MEALLRPAPCDSPARELRRVWLDELEARRGGCLRVGLEGRTACLKVPPGCPDGHVLSDVGGAVARAHVYASLGTGRTPQSAASEWATLAVRVVRIDLPQPLDRLACVVERTVAHAFNRSGWRGVLRVLRRHLRIPTGALRTVECRSLPDRVAGRCRVVAGVGTRRLRFDVAIAPEFADEPFSAGAVLGHELAHVVYYLHHAQSLGRVSRMSAGEEEWVDLLVPVLGLGRILLAAQRTRRRAFSRISEASLLHIVRAAEDMDASPSS